MAENGIEKFRSGTSRMAGYGALALALGAAVLVLVDGYQDNEWKVLSGLAFFAFGCWVVLLRPVIGLGDDSLLVRSMLSEVTLPLASVEDVQVRQFFLVRAGGHTWSSTGLGRSRRHLTRLVREAKLDLPPSGAADVAEGRLQQASENARSRAGIAAFSDEQFELAADVRRTWSLPVIIALGVLAIVSALAVLT